jgi:hypothetical protein
MGINENDETIKLSINNRPIDVIEEMLLAQHEAVTEAGTFQIMGTPLELELLTQLKNRKDDNLASELSLKYILELRLSIRHITKLVAEREMLLEDKGIQFNSAFNNGEGWKRDVQG